MPKPRTTLGVPPTVESLGAAVGELQRLFGQGFTIGDPHGTSTVSLTPRQTLAGGVVRPAQVIGVPDNLIGNWCEVTIEVLTDIGATQNLRIYHGLKLPVPAANPGSGQTLNVRWTPMGIRFNRVAALPINVGPALYAAFVYVDGAVDADWIDLRLWSNLTAAELEPEDLVLTLFFWPASR